LIKFFEFKLIFAAFLRLGRLALADGLLQSQHDRDVVSSNGRAREPVIGQSKAELVNASILFSHRPRHPNLDPILSVDFASEDVSQVNLLEREIVAIGVAYRS